MKILQVSDTHYGITSEKSIKNLFKKASEEEFDILVHCGDYCGGIQGYKTLKCTVEIMRKYIPDKPIITVLGNHDYYSGRSKNHRSNKDYGYTPLRNTPPPEAFTQNYENIVETFKANDIHFLDTDGPYRHPMFYGWVIVGHSGWYSNPNPPSNDANFLPTGLEGDTHRYMLKRALNELDGHLEQINPDNDETVIFISHFNVIPDSGDQSDKLGGYTPLGNWLQDKYGCQYFLQGHSHKLRNGPLVYECGSDYYKPKYQIIEIT